MSIKYELFASGADEERTNQNFQFHLPFHHDSSLTFFVGIRKNISLSKGAPCFITSDLEGGVWGWGKGLLWPTFTLKHIFDISGFQLCCLRMGFTKLGLVTECELVQMPISDLDTAGTNL